jgi:hypothetical protein
VEAPPANIRQSFELVKPEEMVVALYNTILEEMKTNPFAYKIMVFFPTARVV